MKLSIIKLIIITLILVGIPGVLIQCGKSGSEPEAAAKEGKEDGNSEEKENSESGGILKVDAEMIEKWNIRTAAPESREYIEKVMLNGVVKENKDTTFMIAAPICGIVTGVKKDIGQLAGKGDTLCIINSSELLEIKTRFLKAFQDHRVKKESFVRAQNLVKIKGIEPKELSNREGEYKTAMAEYYSLESRLRSVGFSASELKGVEAAVQKDETEKVKGFLTPFYPITAPASGKVINRDLNLGERVEENKTIFEVSDTRKLWALLDATEKDLQFIEKGKRLGIVSDSYPGVTFQGIILTSMEKIDAELRTVKVRVEVDNSDGRLKPEMYVKGIIEKKEKRDLLALPYSALVKKSGIDGVFVRTADGFVFTPVEVLYTDSQGYTFLKGVKETDQAVVEGAYYLKAHTELQGEEEEGHH